MHLLILALQAAAALHGHTPPSGCIPVAVPTQASAHACRHSPRWPHLVLGSGDEDVVQVEAGLACNFCKLAVLLRQPPHIGASQLHRTRLHTSQPCSEFHCNSEVPRAAFPCKQVIVGFVWLLHTDQEYMRQGGTSVQVSLFIVQSTDSCTSPVVTLLTLMSMPTAAPERPTRTAAAAVSTPQPLPTSRNLHHQRDGLKHSGSVILQEAAWRPSCIKCTAVAQQPQQRC